jgi:hypothetical protein
LGGQRSNPGWQLTTSRTLGDACDDPRTWQEFLMLVRNERT